MKLLTLAGLQVLACLLLEGQNSAPSATPVPPPEPTVVTVTAQATPLSTTSASVIVLSRDYIENSRAETAADLLRGVPFLDFAQSGASGGMTTITIRGAKPNFVLVLIDGIEINDITTLLGGAFDFSALPLDNIEQIEIVRGPLSAVYGSDAIAGVINFISRRGGGPPALDASGELGSFLWRQAKISATGSWKALDYSAAGSFLDVGQQVENDAYSVASLAFNGSLNLGNNRVLDFLVRYLDDKRDTFPAGSGGPEFSILREAQTDHAEELVLGASFKAQVRPWWIYSVDGDRIFRAEESNVPAVLDAIPPTAASLPPSSSNTNFARTHLGATSRFDIMPHLWALLGVGVREESGSSAGYLATLPSNYRINRTSLLANSEIQYSTRQLTATAGLGFEKSTGYGEVTSPRVGLNWRPNEHGTTLRGSWGKGFKLPSFYSLATPIVGNPALRPERGRAFDGGFEQSFGASKISVSATYFRNNFQDLIDFSSAVFRLVNLSQAITQGIEFQTDYAASKKLRLGLDFSYTAWSLRNTTEPLRNIPHAIGGLHADWKISTRWRARAETQFVSRQYDYELPVPDQMATGGYSNTNISADYALSRKVTAYLRGDNLFNNHYHEYIGFPNPGISMRVGVVWHVL